MTVKIMYQEYYDKVTPYSIEQENKALQKHLDKLKTWKEHARHPCEIELYRDFAPYSFPFKQRYADGI